MIQTRVFKVSHKNCTLTNCMSVRSNDTQVMVLQQPSFVMIPVKNTEPLKFDPARTEADILNKLRATLPSWSSFTSLLGGVLGLGVFPLLGLCLLPTLLRYFIRTVWKVKAKMHGIKLCTNH